MGISHDIRPRQHHEPTHRLDFLDERTPPAPIHTEPPTHNNISTETEKPAESHAQKVEHFRIPNPALEDQFFGHSEIKAVEENPKNEPRLPHAKKQSKARLVWALVVVLIFAAAIYKSPYREQLFKKIDTIKINNDDDTKYNGEVVTQDYVTSDNAIAETSPTPTPTPSPAPSATPTPTATVTPINKADIAIRILNGNGITGSADAVKKTLVTAGFTVSSITNAKSFSYLKTYVYYHTGQEDEANLVNAALSNRETTVQLSDTVTGSAYDVVVVVGKK